MDFIGYLIIAVGLAMDAFAVTLSDAVSYPAESSRRLFALPVAFGFFQGFMPFLGYVLSGFAAELIEQYAGIVALVVLAAIGSNMIREGIGVQKAEDAGPALSVVPRLTIPIILLQSIATAIDAFAVGVSLRAMDANLAAATSIIGIVTFLVCCIPAALGRRLGNALGDKAEIAGGIVLILIGLRAFFS